VEIGFASARCKREHLQRRLVRKYPDVKSGQPDARPCLENYISRRRAVLSFNRPLNTSGKNQKLFFVAFCRKKRKQAAGREWIFDFLTRFSAANLPIFHSPIDFIVRL